MHTCSETTNHLIQATSRYISVHLANLCEKIKQGNGYYVLEGLQKMPNSAGDSLTRMELLALQEFITSYNYKYALDNDCDKLINQKLIEMNIAAIKPPKTQEDK